MTATRTGICAAFEAGFEALQFALQQSHPIAFVATSASDSSPFEEKIAALAIRRGLAVYRKIDANSLEFRAVLKASPPDLVFLAWWPSIVKKESIALARRGWVNMHPSFLPYNRGKHPYYWAVVEGTPFGATLHFIDEGVDTGPVLFQKQIPVGPSDTGESLYHKGIEGCLALFRESYEKIVRLEFHAQPQNPQVATSHLKKEIEAHSQIHLDKHYLGQELLDLLRARSFSQGECAYFIQEGRRYRVRVQVELVVENNIDEKKAA